MSASEKAFFCCICGGPFTPGGLVKATTVCDGAYEFPLFKDWCDCGADNYYGDAHRCSCAINGGYDGFLLPSQRIAWLVNARMICARAGSHELVFCNDHPSLCFVTDVGNFTPGVGFECGGKVGTLWPMDDGFMIHDLCWEILNTVFKSKFPRREAIRLPELWISMCVRYRSSRGTAIDWGDNFLYGGAGELHGASWQACPGSEWLVADPTEDVDFAKILDASVIRLSHHTASILEYRDPFLHLPAETIHGILVFLPYSSRISLMLVSRAEREAGGSELRARLTKHNPWLQGTSQCRSFDECGKFVHYGTLQALVEEASSSPRGINSLNAESHWLGLKNRRRIWACCERILDDVENRFSAARDGCGFVSKDVEALSTFRIATVIEPRENEERCAADVYFLPTITDTPSLQAITVYFLPEGSVIGIEFSLDGERSSRIFGNRSTFFQSAAVPASVVINGFLSSLGPELPVVQSRPIKGIGVLTEDSPLQPRFRFGRWTGRDIVQIFRPVCQLPNSEITNQKVVGITRQFNAENIFTFGIIVAVCEPREDNPYRLDIYSRWVENWPPTHSLYPRHGSSIHFDEPYIEPAIHAVQNHYVSLIKCRLASVHAFYPHGDQSPLGGLIFTFVDGSTQLVGRAENDPSIQADIKVTLDYEKNEEIIGWRGGFGRATDRCPHRLYFLSFITNLGRNLDLGNSDAIDVGAVYHYELLGSCRIFGFQIGDSPPWIESFSWVAGGRDQSPEEL